MKKRAWSFSALDMFEKCRKKFYHLKVRKDVKEPDNQWQADGKFVHDALFNYCMNGVPLPVQLADKVMAIPHAEKYGEMRLCLNAELQPRDFFAKDAWVRAVLDLLLINGSSATIIDWKTGKQKPGFDQLRLAAAILSRYMPEITHFILAYAWLKDNELKIEVIRKDELKQVWLEFLPRAAEIDKAEATTDFPANPTPLCGYCPVTSCPHWIDRD
jgi:hypothetical protein